MESLLVGGHFDYVPKRFGLICISSRRELFGWWRAAPGRLQFGDGDPMRLQAAQVPAAHAGRRRGGRRQDVADRRHRRTPHTRDRILETRVETRDDNGSAGHGSSGSTSLSGSRWSRVSTRDPLTHDQVNKISRTSYFVPVMMFDFDSTSTQWS